MKDDTIRWEAEKKAYETLFYAVLERKTKIIDIKKKEEGIGYTDESGDIHIAKTNPLFSRLNAEKRAFFRKGVFAHETLHQCFTDFAYTQKIIDSDKYTQMEKKVIMSFANLVEDPAIEYQAPSAFGGTLLNALRFCIAHIYKKSPSIEASETPFAQLQNALIQFGDMGIVKGKFTFPKAYELFKTIAPEFNAAILNPISKERIDMAVKWMNDTRELWESEDSMLLSKTIKNIQKENGITSTCGEGGQLISADEIFATEKNDATGRREDFINAIKTGNDKEIEDFIQPANEAAKLVAMPESENETILVKSMSEKNEALAEIDDFQVEEGVSCKNERIGAKNADIAIYESIVSKYAQTIKLLENSLRRIFMSDEGGMMRKTSGKYNIKRGAMETSVNVFDKRKAPKNLKDLAIFLLVDESGSMHGNKITVARESAIILAETLSKLDIPCYVLGFTADCRNAGVVHEHFVTWSNLKKERYSLVEIDAHSNNDDPYSIKYAAELLKKHKAEHKLLFVLSDGTPACWRFTRRDGITKTATAIREAKKICKVLGLGIGIYPDEFPSFEAMYGKEFVNVAEPNQLANVLAVQLKRVIRSI